MRYTLNPDQSTTAELVRKARAAGRVALDIETTGLDPFSDDILLIQLCADGDHVLVYTESFPRIALDMLDEITVVGHNLKFDIGFMIQKTGAKFDRVWDTMLAENVLNLGLEKSAALEAVAHRRLGIRLRKKIRDNFINHPKGWFSEEEIAYAAEDTAYLLEIMDQQVIELNRRGLIKVIALENAACPATAAVELQGITLHKERWNALVEATEPKYLTLLESLYAIHPKKKRLHFPLFSTTRTKIETYTTAMNLNSPKAALETLRHLGYDVNKADKRTMATLAPHSKYAAVYIEARKMEKALSSFLWKMPDHVNPITGRIHASYWQLSSRMGGSTRGADSGRYSCTDPNLQQMQSDAAYRACFVPGHGNVFVAYDYSSQEIRIVGNLSREQVLIDFFASTLDDYHRYMAQQVFHVPYNEVDAKLRRQTKAVNFGLIYGITKFGLSAQLLDTESFEEIASTVPAEDWSDYVYNAVEEQKAAADEIIKAYERAMPTLMGTLKTWARRAERTREATDYTLGRIRQFGPDFPDYKIGRVGQNHPVQGTAANMCKEALVALHNKGVRTALMVHDEILAECKAEDAEEVAHIMEREMLKAANEVCPGPIKYAVDGGVSDHWKK